MQRLKLVAGIGNRVGLAWILVPALALLLGLPIACTGPKTPTKMFEDVTLTSGLSGYQGMTHGAYWGDFAGDGRPGLYVTNHLNWAKLYRNLGNGRFEDVTGQWFAPKDILGDKHGAAFADFDNDGRLDLVQLTGADRGVGFEPKRLFHNLGNRFEDVGETMGIANPLGRTRTPLWFDFNRDGLLDLFEGAEERFDGQTPPFIFIQKDGKFEAAGDVAKFASPSTPFCIVTELTNSGFSDLVCRTYGKTQAAQVFSTAKLPLQELDLLPQTAFEDIAAGDFNNDGFIDLFLARKNQAPAVSFGRPAVNQAIADLYIDQGNATKPLGFSFRTPGQIAFRVVSEFPGDAITPDRIHIGSRGSHPVTMEFPLSSESAGVTGSVSYQPGSEAGLYISHTPPDKWELRVSATRNSVTGGKSKFQHIEVKVTSSAAITDLAVIGDPFTPEEAPLRLLINRGGKLVDESEKWGVNARSVSAVSVVAGDFNNDMYLDLFVVVSGDTGKQENLLLLNRGDGHFDVVPGAGGAAGGPIGVGDSVTTADFDGSGFLGLLVTTGGSMGRSMGLPSEAGSYHLYRNLGNGNHWLEIDLEGTKSNRDGIGARVQLAAGGVTQVRIQDGGIHNHAQNHSRLHFGLAKYTQADKITIRWPSGTTQELTNVKGDQIIRIKEP